MLNDEEKEKFTYLYYFPAFAGCFLSSFVAGSICASIVIVKQVEMSYMPWVIGCVAGFSVILYSEGKKGLPLQVIAIFSCAFGILVGEYIIFIAYDEELSHLKTGSAFSFFYGAAIEFFRRYIFQILNWHKVLWVVFAFVTSWLVPKLANLKR